MTGTRRSFCSLRIQASTSKPLTRDNLRSSTTRGLAWFALLEESSVAVIKVFQFDPRNLLADESLDGIYVPDIFRDHQGEGVAFVFHAPGAADAMNIIFRVLRHVIIDDVADIGNIQA